MTTYIAGDKKPYFIWMTDEKLAPEYIDTGSTKYLPAKIDTSAVIKDYYAKKRYRKVFKDDTSAFIKLWATLSQNGFDSLGIEFQNRRKIQINNYANNPPLKNRFYLTVSGGYDFLNKKPVIGAGIALISKKRFGYELQGNTAGILQFQLNYKININH